MRQSRETTQYPTESGQPGGAATHHTRPARPLLEYSPCGQQTHSDRNSSSSDESENLPCRQSEREASPAATMMSASGPKGASLLSFNPQTSCCYTSTHSDTASHPHRPTPLPSHYNSSSPDTSRSPEDKAFKQTTLFPRNRPPRRMSTVPGTMEARTLGAFLTGVGPFLATTSSAG